jgi:hypothetical protein
VAEQLIGQPLERAAELDPLDLGERLEAPAEKLGNLLVVEDALRDCLGPVSAAEPRGASC